MCLDPQQLCPDECELWVVVSESPNGARGGERRGFRVLRPKVEEVVAGRVDRISRPSA